MKRSAALHTLSAVSLTAVLPSWASAADAVKFATIPIDSGAQVYYAAAEGFFKKAGIDEAVQSIGNGSAITSAVVGGSIDIGFSNVLSLATAHERGIPVTLIAPAGLYLTKAPTSVLMVPKDSSARSASDLNGKTIAVNGLRNITQLAVQAWMDKNGGDSKSAQFVEVSFPNMPLALETHRVDAALVAEPSVARASGTARVLGRPYDAIAPEFLIAGWFTTESWATAHPDLVKKVAGVLRESAVWANKNPEATAEILGKSTKIKPATLRTMVRAVYEERLDPRMIQPLIDIAARYGYLKSAFPAQDLIDRNAG